MDGAVEEHEQHRQCRENDSGPRSPRLHEGSSSHLIAGQIVKLIVQARKSLQLPAILSGASDIPLIAQCRIEPHRLLLRPRSGYFVGVVVDGGLSLPSRFA